MHPFKLFTAKLPIAAIALSASVAGTLAVNLPASAACLGIGNCTISLNGNDYSISTVTAPANTIQSLLESQVWWGNQALSDSAAMQVGTVFNSVSAAANGGWSPWFAWNNVAANNAYYGVPSKKTTGILLNYFYVDPANGWTAYQNGAGQTGSFCDSCDTPDSWVTTYAVATPNAAVPEPSTILGITLGGIGVLSRRSKASPKVKQPTIV
jgi:hypothetical protein